MSWAQEEQRRLRAVYEAAVGAWYRAKSEGHIVEETDSRERSAGVRWKGNDPEGRAVLSTFRLAKANLDAISERVQREAGNEECPTCPKKDARPVYREPEPDSRLPPEHDEAPL